MLKKLPLESQVRIGTLTSTPNSKKQKTHFQARTCGRRSAAPLCQNLEILWRTVPSGANGPGRREIHRGKCFETNIYDAANSLLGIPGRGKCFETRRISELKETQKLISRHEHADAARRLPSVRILKFFGGRLHWEQMDQGVARSTVGNVLKQILTILRTHSWGFPNFWQTAEPELKETKNSFPGTNMRTPFGGSPLSES